MGLVYGIGIHTKGKYKATVGNKITREFNLWRGMLKRCYCKNDLLRYPSYNGCTVSKEFLNFMLWAERQVGFDAEGYQLDKDALIEGNRVYSAETCVFVPPPINMFFAAPRTNIREGLPTGVCYTNQSVGGKKYRYLHAYINNKEGKRIKLGIFDSVGDAESAYLLAKMNRAKELAYEFDGKVDTRVITVLLNFNPLIKEWRNPKLVEMRLRTRQHEDTQQENTTLLNWKF